MPESSPAGWLAEEWSNQLKLVFQSMAGEAPAVTFAPCDFSETRSASVGEGFFWWRQAFNVDASALVWIGAKQESWQDAGNRVLRSAGVDDLDPDSARSTYLEVIQQGLSGVSGALSSLVGREVACSVGSAEPPSELGECYSFEITFGEHSIALFAVFSKTLSALSDKRAGANAVDAPRSPQVRPAQDTRPANSIDLLLDVELPVSISFGRAQLALKDVIKLTTGSIVELNRAISEPVEVIVNNCVIARGEVVVVEGNFGIRIKEVISRQERLRTLN